MNDQTVSVEDMDYIERLERMIYYCVTLRDVMMAGEDERLYSQIVRKFEGEDNDE